MLIRINIEGDNQPVLRESVRTVEAIAQTVNEELGKRKLYNIYAQDNESDKRFLTLYRQAILRRVLGC